MIHLRIPVTLALLAFVAAVPASVMAAAWPKQAFSEKEAGAALNALLGGQQHQPSDAIKLTAPEIAENGAVVPVSVRFSMSAPNANVTLLCTESNPSLKYSVTVSRILSTI